MPNALLLVTLALGLSDPISGVAAQGHDTPVAPPPVPGAALPAFSVDEVAMVAAGAGSGPGDIRVRIELLSAESRTALNGQSADLLLDLDCDHRQVRLRKVLVYPVAHQTGPASPAIARTDWLLFNAHSYAAQIGEGLCARRGELAAAAAPDGDPPPAAQRPPTREQGQAAPVPVSAPTRISVPATVPVLSAGIAPPAGGVGGVLIQYLSSTVQADIDQAAAKVRERLGGDLGGLTLSTQTVALRGRTYYRGRIGAFASVSEAKAFCVKVRRLGLACLPLSTGPEHGF